jgi:DNA invertase Pin-like site-specific DNA recombinase
MTNTRPPRVAIWCAVSSKAQAADDKISLDDQERAGREFADAIHGHVVRVYRIPGHTRDLIFWHQAEADMPAYRQLRHDLEARAFDVLHAIDPDRLGRDPALSNQVISLVEKSGAEIYLASAPHVVGQKGTGTRYVYAIQTVRAGEDQQRRVAHARMGIRKRIERGLPGNNLWPLGYRRIRDPDTGRITGAQFDELADAVRLATDLFLRGETYLNIKSALDASIHHPPHKDRWTYSTVRKMLHNDTYAGRPAWGKYRHTTPSPLYPALWDETTYQAILRERRRRSGRKHRRRQGSPLANVAYCARCGGRMTRTRHKTQYWLRCATHNSRTVTGHPGCHSNKIRELTILAAVTSYVAGLLTSNDLTARLTARDPNTALHAQLIRLDHALSDLNQKRQRLALALASGTIDPEIYRTTDDLILDDINKLNDAKDNIQGQLHTTPDPAVRYRTILDLSRQLTQPDTPAIELSTALQDAGIRIECENRQITAIYLIY